jgi:hypothetical protein
MLQKAGNQGRQGGHSLQLTPASHNISSSPSTIPQRKRNSQQEQPEYSPSPAAVAALVGEVGTECHGEYRWKFWKAQEKSYYYIFECFGSYQQRKQPDALGVNACINYQGLLVPSHERVQLARANLMCMSMIGLN